MRWFKRRKEANKRAEQASQTNPKPSTPGGLWSWLRRPKITIDLGHPKHRRNLFFGLLGFTIAGSAFLFGNYKAYEYTESAEFCGEACHVMAPQQTRYERSPHANVDCVKCHIGPGASFFVKSKIDGMQQVYAVLTDTYNRPIASPVHDLRPARETCETCHTPTSFNDNIIKTIVHYDDDEANTRIQSTLILKMGGWQESTGVSQGIHWHITNPVYYIAADEQRQVILWVGVEQEDGSLREYYARDVLTMAQSLFVEQAYETEQVRLMDCIDCHNRTAHHIPSPQESVDDAIDAGLIAQNIPYIRSKAVEVLAPAYASENEAYTAIDGLADYYTVGFADVVVDTNAGVLPRLGDETRALLESALDEIKQIYSETNFPEMKMNWLTNPNNARHTPSLGCFRCHDGKHVNVDESGQEVETISVKCNLCHTVPIVGRGDELLVESPVITGATPDSHSDFRWTIEHRIVTEAERQDCYQCHGQGFCNNGVCHNLSHPPDMLFTHADEYYKQGDQVCYTCHQNILCSRCHPGGIVGNP